MRKFIFYGLINRAYAVQDKNVALPAEYNGTVTNKLVVVNLGKTW